MFLLWHVTDWNHGWASTVCTRTRLVLHGPCDDIICWLRDRKLCNPPLLCHFQLWPCLCASLWYSSVSDWGLVPGYSWLCLSWGVRTALFCLKQLKHLYSIGKVEFKEAGAGNSWASRLGYKWKHFLQSVLQDFFPFRVVNSTSCCRSLFSALFLFSSSATNCAGSI